MSPVGITLAQVAALVHRILEGLARLGIIPHELLHLAPHSIGFLATAAVWLADQALGSRKARSSALELPPPIATTIYCTPPSI